MSYYRISQSDYDKMEKQIAELMIAASECAAERNALREEVKYLREQNKTLLSNAFPPIVTPAPKSGGMGGE